MTSARLRPNLEFSTVHGETTVISCETGYYYSVRGPGSDLLEALREGPVELPEVAGLAEFISQAHELVETGEFEGRPAKRSWGPYPELAFQRCTELADILTLDPIHETSEAGWPSKP